MSSPLDRNNDLSKLHPHVRERVETALADAQAQGLDIHVFEGFRSPERQALIFAQGRTTPGSIVTNARPGFSAHAYGLAVDLVFGGEGKWSWDGDYEKLGKIMEDHCFEWGKHFQHFPEMDHFQMLLGLTVEDLKAVYDDGGLSVVWQKLDDIMDGVNA